MSVTTDTDGRPFVRQIRDAVTSLAWVGAVVVVGLAQSTAMAAAGPTFYQDIAPILRSQCQDCHRSNGRNLGGLVAPMALTTYEEVRPWAKAIAQAVRNREMPPWAASDDTKGLFENERHLTPAQIEMFVTWAQTETPAGSKEDPQAVSESAAGATDGWSLGEPDLIMSAGAYWLGDDVREDMVTIEAGELPADAWVQGIEFRAGSTAVHHMCGSAILRKSTVDGHDQVRSLGCAAPGATPQEFPDGYAILLPRGASIRLDMHFYKKVGAATGVWDRSQVGLTFSRGPVHHPVRTNPAINVTFEVPPGQSDWRVGAVRVFETDTTILALWPHGHSRTTAVAYRAIYPNGDRELLLQIPRYDYRWQAVYQYKAPRRVPAGTRVEVLYRFDNSAARAARKGFDSSQTVRYGLGANDEMMVAYITYAELHGDGETTQPSSDVTTHDAAAHNDAVDPKQFHLETTALPNQAGVTVAFPIVTATDSSLLTVDTLRPGSVVSYLTGPVVKLRTDVTLRFSRLSVSSGNTAVGYPGLYGLWVKRTETGWSLVFTTQPDVWGTQYESSSEVGETPLRHTLLTSPASPLTIGLTSEHGGSRLTIVWGRHEWTADFAPH
jgi:mono/diheme cytochrome c family protein